MKHTQCNQESVALHKRRFQSVVAWKCDSLKAALTGGTDMFAVEAVELLPSRLRVSRSHHRVILLSQI